jgi:hypothetical protein
MDLGGNQVWLAQGELELTDNDFITSHSSLTSSHLQFQDTFAAELNTIETVGSPLLTLTDQDGSLVSLNQGQLTVSYNDSGLIQSTLTSSTLTIGNASLDAVEGATVGASTLTSDTLTTTYLAKDDSGKIAIGDTANDNTAVAFGPSAYANATGAVVLATASTNYNNYTMISPASVMNYADTTTNNGSVNFRKNSGLQSCLSGETVAIANADILSVSIIATAGNYFIANKLTTVITNFSGDFIPGNVVTIILQGANGGSWTTIGSMILAIGSSPVQYSAYEVNTSLFAYNEFRIRYEDATLGGTLSLRSFITGGLINLVNNGPGKNIEKVVKSPKAAVASKPVAVKHQKVNSERRQWKNKTQAKHSKSSRKQTKPVGPEVKPEPVAEVKPEVKPEVKAEEQKPGVLGWLFGAKPAPKVEKEPEVVINKPSRPMSQRQINALKKLSELDVKTIMN